jgi:hypothetical protein
VDAVAQDARPGADHERGPDGAHGAEPGDGSAPGTAQANLLRSTWKDPVVLLAAALVLVPAVAAMASALRNSYLPTNDWALLELQVRAVGTGDTPLVGAWSRFGWDHPGPWPLYFMALPYRLVPAEHGLLFAAATVNFVALAGCAALALRRPRAQALVVLAGLAVLERGLGVGSLSDPWNPILPIIPFVAYCLLCIEIAVEPRRWMVPLAAAAGSFVVQAHVGFAQPVVILGATACALAYWRQRSHRDAPDAAPRRSLWSRGLPTAVVLIVAWAPVVLDQVAGEGNVGRFARWVAGDDLGVPQSFASSGRLGGTRIVRAAAWLLDPAGLWIGEFEVPHFLGFDLLGNGRPLILLWLPLTLGASLVLAKRLLSRADGWRVLCACGIAAAAAVATFTDLFTTRGAPVLWPFRWAAVVSMLAFVALGWAVVGTVVPAPHAAGQRARALRGAAAAALVVLVAAPVVATVWRGSLGQQPMDELSDPVQRLEPAILESAREEDLVVANSEVLLEPIDLAVPVILDRAGIRWVELDDPRGDRHAQLSLLPARVLDGMLGQLIRRGDAEIVARSGPPRPGEETEVVLVRTFP